MPIADRAELLVAVKELMGASFDKVSDEGFDRAGGQAELELRWPYPITDAQREYWQIERCKRHVIYVLYVEAAHKFQYKQIHMEHRHKQYHIMLQKMDEDFSKAIDDNMALFADIGASWERFSYTVDAGFLYDDTGRDVTYLNE